MSRKIWMGDKPVACDICDKPITNKFIDGKVGNGPWGILCPSCHMSHGCGLGLGKGQEYTREDIVWVKTAG